MKMRMPVLMTGREYHHSVKDGSDFNGDLAGGAALCRLSDHSAMDDLVFGYGCVQISRGMREAHALGAELQTPGASDSGTAP
jgi:hypothetical protein